MLYIGVIKLYNNSVQRIMMGRTTRQLIGISLSECPVAIINTTIKHYDHNVTCY